MTHQPGIWMAEQKRKCTKYLWPFVLLRNTMQCIYVCSEQWSFFKGGAEVIIWLWQLLCRAIHGSAPLANSCQRGGSCAVCVIYCMFATCIICSLQRILGESKIHCEYNKIECGTNSALNCVLPTLGIAQSGQWLSKGGNLEVFRHCPPGATHSTVLLSHVGAQCTWHTTKQTW